MREIPGYPDPYATVVEDAATRLVCDGRAWNVIEHEVTHGMVSGFASLMSAGGDLLAPTGWAVVQPLDYLVFEDRPLPWDDNRFPSPGDPVTVEEGLRDGDGRDVRAPSLTGRVDSVQIAEDGTSARVEFSGMQDMLDRKITSDPLYHFMPQTTPGLTDLPRVRLYQLHPLTVAARAAGFNATPPMRGGTALVSMPMMGSTWPERGRIRTSWSDRAEEDNFPMFARTPWGLGLSEGTVTCFPDGVLRLSSPVYMHMLVDIPAGAEGAAYTEARWTDAENQLVWRMRLVVTRSTAALQVYVGDEPVHTERVVRAHSSVGETPAHVWVHPDGQVELSVGALYALGRVTVPSTPHATSPATQPAKMVVVGADGAGMSVGGVLAGVASTPFDLQGWSRNMDSSFPVPHVTKYFPGFYQDSARSIIEDWAARTFGGAWLDERGHLVLRHVDDLVRSSPAVLTIPGEHVFTSDARALWQSSRESALVTYRKSYGGLSRYPKMTVWEGSGLTLERDEVYETLIHPDADTLWIGVALDGLKHPTFADHAQINRGQGSWLSAVVEGEDDTERMLSASQVSGSVTRVDGRTYLVQLVAPGVPAGEQAVLRFPEASWVPKRFRGADTPLVRAHAACDLQDEVQASSTRGRQGLGEHDHDAGWWLQEPSQALRLADLIASFVCRGVSQTPPFAFVADVPPDDRVQIGDVVRVAYGSLPSGRRVPVMRMLVTEITRASSTESGRSMSLTLIPIRQED